MVRTFIDVQHLIHVYMAQMCVCIRMYIIRIRQLNGERICESTTLFFIIALKNFCFFCPLSLSYFKGGDWVQIGRHRTFREMETNTRLTHFRAKLNRAPR